MILIMMVVMKQTGIVTKIDNFWYFRASFPSFDQVTDVISVLSVYCMILCSQVSALTISLFVAGKYSGSTTIQLSSARWMACPPIPPNASSTLRKQCAAIQVRAVHSSSYGELEEASLSPFFSIFLCLCLSPTRSLTHSPTHHTHSLTHPRSSPGLFCAIACQVSAAMPVTIVDQFRYFQEAYLDMRFDCPGGLDASW